MDQRIEQLSPLGINRDQQRKINRCVCNAEDHRRNYRMVQRGREPEADPRAVIYLPGSSDPACKHLWRCVFVIEQLPSDGHWYRHLSVRRIPSDYWPSTVWMGELMKAFHFRAWSPVEHTVQNWTEVRERSWHVRERVDG